MNYEQNIRKSDAVIKVEDEVSCPDKVRYREDKPSYFWIEINVGNRVRKSSIVEFDSSEDEPSKCGIDENNGKTDLIESYFHVDD